MTKRNASNVKVKFFLLVIKLMHYSQPSGLEIFFSFRWNAWVRSSTMNRFDTNLLTICKVGSILNTVEVVDWLIDRSVWMGHQHHTFQR